MKKALDPQMTIDDVMPLEDDDIGVAFYDDFDDRQQANVIASNALPPNLVHPIARTFRSNMAHASSVNAMLLVLRQQTFSQ